MSAPPLPMARYAMQERQRDQFDKLIAAHALSLQIILVTNNVRDFVAYAGIRIENWLDEPARSNTGSYSGAFTNNSGCNARIRNSVK